jgi:hypothetical protein
VAGERRRQVGPAVAVVAPSPPPADPRNEHLLAMNRAEATDILRRYLAQYRALSYAQLDALVDASPLIGDALGPKGTRYEIEVRVVRDRGPGEPIRVLALIDDRGWRALAPLRDGFVVAADGSVRDEVPAQ